MEVSEVRPAKCQARFTRAPVSTYFDFKNNRFVAVWSSSRQIRIAAFHPQSGGLTLAPSVLANAAGSALHVQSSYHNSLGFAISDWKNSRVAFTAFDPPRFRSALNHSCCRD